MLKKRRFPEGEAISIICENTDNYGNLCGNGTITLAVKDEFECNVPLTIIYYCDRCKREIIVKILDTEIVTKSTNNLKYGNDHTRNLTNSNNVLPPVGK